MGRVPSLVRDLFVTAVLLMGATPPVEPCTIVRPVSPREVVDGAEAIIRAAAVDYVVAPRDPRIVTTGSPDSRVRFRVIEVVKGALATEEVVLPGYVTDRDDFNDHEPPYTFVRPGGRSGSCFANSYRKGAEFLLMLKRNTAGDYTVNWYGLGPVNEQLKSADDPWLLWVRRRVGEQGQRPAKAFEPAAPSLPVVTPIFITFEPGRGPAFLIECVNDTGKPVSSASDVWPLRYSAFRIDQRVVPDPGEGRIGPGLTMTVEPGATWRGFIELWQATQTVSRAVTFGALARAPFSIPLQPGRHTIAVRCGERWSDDVAFYVEK